MARPTPRPDILLGMKTSSPAPARPRWSTPPPWCCCATAWAGSSASCCARPRARRSAGCGCSRVAGSRGRRRRPRRRAAGRGARGAGGDRAAARRRRRWCRSRTGAAARGAPAVRHLVLPGPRCPTGPTRWSSTAARSATTCGPPRPPPSTATGPGEVELVPPTWVSLHRLADLPDDGGRAWPTPAAATSNTSAPAWSTTTGVLVALWAPDVAYGSGDLDWPPGPATACSWTPPAGVTSARTDRRAAGRPRWPMSRAIHLNDARAESGGSDAARRRYG